MEKNNNLMSGKGEPDFEYDPEAEDNSKKYRLPFALCKARGIKIEDWWTPRNAWDALRDGGYVDDVSEEYKEFYRQLKKESSKTSNERAKRKKDQLQNPTHNPEKIENHIPGTIAGVKCGQPMTFEQADGGSVNPFFNGEFIGYRHNCQTCVAVYFARRKGYDVRALPNLNNKNIYQLSIDTTLAFVKDDGTHPIEKSKSYYQKNIDFLNNEISDNRVYSLRFNWKGRRDGHIVVAEKMGGKVCVYDPQTNKKYNDGAITQFLSRTTNLKLADLTDYNLDESFCDSIMKGVNNYG